MKRSKVKGNNRFIGASERRQRVIVLMPAKGFSSLNQLAEAMGMSWSSLDKSLKSEQVTAQVICRLADALDVTVNFLLER